MANRYLENRRAHEFFKNIAVWKYWAGCEMENYGSDGSIRVFSFEDGWFCFIPRKNGITSVGPS